MLRRELVLRCVTVLYRNHDRTHALQQISDDEQAEVDAAWRSELRRRIDDIESGKVELLDADEVHAQIRAKLAAMRK